MGAPSRMVAILVLSSVAILVLGTIAVTLVNNGIPRFTARTATATVIPGFTLSYQHSDNIVPIPCQWCGFFMPWHFNVAVQWDDVKYGGQGGGPPGDNLYGAVGAMDDCPHCIVYSGPACIQMMAFYRVGITFPQDLIYDQGELQVPAGEIQGNMQIERHGFGLTDAVYSTPPEIQTAFMSFVGPLYVHNQTSMTPLTPALLSTYIAGSYPVMWDDHNGWPVNMDPTWPSANKSEQGHYKVIAGYDDNNTPADTTDDLALIYDPWPEYTDKSILPAGASQGPGGTFDPYWLNVSTVLADTSDMFFVEFAAISEFSGIVLPIVGMTIVMAVAWRMRNRRKDF